MVCVACLDQREKRGAQLPKAVGNDLNLDQYEFEALFSVILSNRCLDTGHRLRTHKEGLNQRYLKNWADVADKICFGRT
jgi:hypothetical protein